MRRKLVAFVLTSVGLVLAIPAPGFADAVDCAVDSTGSCVVKIVGPSDLPLNVNAGLVNCAVDSTGSCVVKIVGPSD